MSDDMPRPVTVSDDRIISALSDGPDPIRTVPEMAEEVELSHDGLRRRLLELEEDGKVTSKDVGANAVVWWTED
jgi:predicted ArsR family transcriptional regulator